MTCDIEDFLEDFYVRQYFHSSNENIYEDKELQF